jgi:hypothetical protein
VKFVTGKKYFAPYCAGTLQLGGCYMANKKSVRVRWTKDDYRTLKAHSKAKTPVVKISKQMKRTVGALRQKALKLGIGLGHQR